MADIPIVPDNCRHVHRVNNVIFFTGPPLPEGNEEWWPGYPDINKMYRHPAFQVSRDRIGYVEGGDYVRGSTSFPGVLGGIVLPGTSGNCLSVPYHASFNPGGTPTQMTVVVQIAPVEWADDGENRDILV